MVHTKDIRETFSLFDHDADGRVAVGDVGIMIRSLGANPSEPELAALLRDAAVQRTIDFEQFSAIAEQLVQNIDPESELTKAFQLFDTDQTGSIATSHLKQVMLSVGEKLSENDIDELLALGDPQRTGRLEYRTLIKLLLE